MRKSIVGLGLVSLITTGCGGGTPTSVVIPKDPTPLAKCDVAKSNARPLVTEWPASEKAHLESLIASQAVVVSYSGCEMQLLDGCRIPGQYGFQRTSISNDTIEITSADELYAKIPLGAAGLEGELSATGRLAINTTVVGQLRLETNVELPDTAACRGATHIITSISIGAFEMTSGGAVKGAAGVEFGNAGAGVSSESKESSLKSSGDRASCRETGDEPNPDCQSPLQVFLQKTKVGESLAMTSTIPGAPEPNRIIDDKVEPQPGTDPDIPSPEPRPQPVVRPTPRPRPRPQARKPWDQPPPDQAVTVLFEAPGGAEGDKWKVLSREGDVLCDSLPCTRRVGNNAGIQLQLDAARKEDIRVFPVPADLGYSPGRTVRAVPEMGVGGNWVFPAIATGAGVAALGGGTVMLIMGRGEEADDPDTTENETESNTTLVTGGTILLGAGVIGAVYGGLALLGAFGGGDKQQGELDITLVEDASAGVSLDLLPSGLSLTF